jgi:hypothetical protein
MLSLPPLPPHKHKHTHTTSHHITPHHTTLPHRTHSLTRTFDGVVMNSSDYSFAIMRHMCVIHLRLCFFHTSTDHDGMLVTNVFTTMLHIPPDCGSVPCALFYSLNRGYIPHTKCRRSYITFGSVGIERCLNFTHVQQVCKHASRGDARKLFVASTTRQRVRSDELPRRSCGSGASVEHIRASATEVSGRCVHHASKLASVRDYVSNDVGA